MTEYGIWTQSAQLLCPECATKIGTGMKLRMKYAYGTGFCEHCHKEIPVDSGLAQEQKLVYKARQEGFIDAFLTQTGGMCHATAINFTDYAGHDWCCMCSFQVNPADPGEYYWYVDTLAEELDIESTRTATSIDEILGNIHWMQRNCMALPSTQTDAELGDMDR